MLEKFLTSLFEHGRVEVPGPAQTDSDTLSPKAIQILREADALRRLDLPGGLPEFSLEAAEWGATLLYRAAQFLVHRDASAEVIQKRLVNRSRTASRDRELFSADLCLQYIPDLLRLSRAASENDPLNHRLLAIMADWPLSGVGVGLDLPEDFTLFENRGLRVLVIERVVARNDLAALNVCCVREAMIAETGTLTGQLPKRVRDQLEINRVESTDEQAQKPASSHDDPQIDNET